MSLRVRRDMQAAQPELAVPGARAPEVSVVIPTFRRAELLDTCLAAVVAQAFAPAAFEVIVVDDGNDAETRRVVEGWAARAQPTGLALHYLAMAEQRGPAAARNAGWCAARGALIAFTDDDCIPDPDWLRAGAQALRSGAEAASGTLVMPLRARPTDYERDAAELANAEFVTANCFCSRATLARIGGFDERFTQAWREDSDLYFSMLEQRARVVRAPGARVIHPIRPAAWGVSLRQQRKSAFNALLYKKHGVMYRRHIQAHAPRHYYAALGALLAFGGCTLAGRRTGALAAAIVWVVLTLRFTLRRLRTTSHAPRHVADMLVSSALIPVLSVIWRLRGAWRYRVWFW